MRSRERGGGGGGGGGGRQRGVAYLNYLCLFLKHLHSGVRQIKYLKERDREIKNKVVGGVYFLYVHRIFPPSPSFSHDQHHITFCR